MRKFLFRLGLVFFILLIAGGVVIFNVTKNSRGQVYPNPNSLPKSPDTSTPKPPPDPATTGANPANWKQYADKKYGFSLLYPPDWQLLDQPNVSGIEIQKINSQGLGMSISVRELENPQNLSAEDFAKAQVYPRDNGVKDPPQKVAVASTTGFKLQYLPPGLLLDLYLPYKPIKILNVFAGGSFDSTQKQNLDYFNQVVGQILSTLKVMR